MSGGEKRYQSNKDEEVTFKEKLTAVYDWFGWHGVAQIYLLFMFIFCMVLGMLSFRVHMRNESLQRDIERNQIVNEHIAEVSMDENNSIVSIENLHYKGVCELSSVRFDADGDTCYYYCWWSGDIGDSSRSSLELPCKVKSK